MFIPIILVAAIFGFRWWHGPLVKLKPGRIYEHPYVMIAAAVIIIGCTIYQYLNY